MRSTSPFVRKVLVTAIETGQDAEIERVKTNTADPELGQCNPLNKIPALVLEDGSVLIDSAVICEFLDTRKGGKLFRRIATRWSTLSRMALCDGMMDAAILRRYERSGRRLCARPNGISGRRPRSTSASGALEKRARPASATGSTSAR